MRWLLLVMLVACGDNRLVPDAALDVPIDAALDSAPYVDLAITPTEHDFGSVSALAQMSDPYAFTVENRGTQTTGPLEVLLSGSGMTSFEIVSTSCTALAPSSTCSVSVRAVHTTLGSKSAILTVRDGAEVAMAGLSFVALTGGGGILISPGAQSFGTIALDRESFTAPLTVTNTSGITTGVLTTTLAGTTPGDFEIVADTCDGMSLAPVQTCTIDVRFAPAVAGARSAALHVTTTPGGSTATALTGTAVLPSQISATPTNAMFGLVIVGLSSTRSITIENTGSSTTGTIASSITGSTMFTVESDTCHGNALAVGASCALVVRFTPVWGQGRRQVATIELAGMQSGDATIAVLGEADLGDGITANPASMTFAATTVGSSSASQTFTVTNTGGAPSGNVTTNLGGNDASHFSISNDTCMGAAIAAGSSCTFDVVFTPMSAGPKSANVSVSTTPGGTATVGLNGEGL
jgi:hypothetical protein